MTKQSEKAKAKLDQGYQPNGKKCATCKHRMFDLVLPAWMVEDNKAEAARGGGEPRYGDEFMVAKNQRCGIGGFAIKASGLCDRHDG